MTEDQLTSLRARLNDSTDIDSLWTVISGMSESLRAGIVSDDNEATISALAVDKMSRAEESQSEVLYSAIEWGGKIALNNSERLSNHGRYDIQKTRVNVGSWLKKLNWKQREVHTKQLLGLAVNWLKGEGWRQACWLISSIGWREAQIENVLMELADQDAGVKGDFAFCTLMDLGVPASRHYEYVAIAHRRFVDRPNRQNVISIHRLKSPSSLDILSGPFNWLSTEDEQYGWMFIPLAISHIADSSNNDQVASKAIRIFSDLFQSYPDKVRSSIFMGGNIIPLCDSQDTVPLLLRLLVNCAVETPEALHPQSLLLLRSEQCMRPRQLKGFSAFTTDEQFDRILRKSLSVPNEYVGRSATFDGDVKERFWNLCLSIGNPDSLELGLDLIEADKNPYTQFKILEDLSCFVLPRLTPTMRSWVTAPESPDADTNGEVLQRMAAIRVAWSFSNREAFDLFLTSQYMPNGFTLADSANGLSYLAVELGKQQSDRDYILAQLINALEQGPKPPQSGSVCHALEAMSWAGYLRPQDFAVIGRLIEEKSAWIARDEKGPLAGVLSKAPREYLTTAVVDSLKAWALDQSYHAATGAFEALIEHDLFLSLSEVEYQRLGLTREARQWKLRSDDKLTVNGGLYALLVSKDPEAFSEVFRELIQNAPSRTLLEAMESLKRIRRKRSIPFTSGWINALLQRAKSGNSRYSAEPFIFECLRENAPGALASESWPSEFATWPAEAREALAVALGLLQQVETDELASSVKTLKVLQNDAHFGVRRAAFRSLGANSPLFLEEFVRTGAYSVSPAVRILSCEAMYWITQTNRAEWWQDLSDDLEDDPADDVRDAMSVARERARKLEWAHQYEKIIIAPFIQGNTDILERWKYATAISHLGDDETAKSFREYLQSSSLPAHVQRFIIRTTEALEKNWEKCRKKWPEPLFPSGITLRSGSGFLEIRGEQIPVRYVLWETVTLDDPLRLTWSGTAVSERPLNYEFLTASPISFAEKVGHERKIVMVSFHHPSRIWFVAETVES